MPNLTCQPMPPLMIELAAIHALAPPHARPKDAPFAVARITRTSIASQFAVHAT